MSDTLVTTLFCSIFQVTVIYHDGLMEHEQKGAFLSCTDPAFRAGKMKNKVLVGTTRLEQHQQLPDELPPGVRALSSGRTLCSLMAFPEGSQKAQTLNILVTLAVWSKSATLLLKLIPGKSKLSFKQELLVRLSYNADTCCTLINVKVTYFTKYIGKKLLKEKEEQTKKLNNASEKSNFLFFSSKALSEQNTFGNS